MTKKKKPTLKEVTKVVGQNQFAIRSTNQVLKEYIEYKGDLIGFQGHMDKKVREAQEKAKAEKEPKE